MNTAQLRTTALAITILTFVAGQAAPLLADDIPIDLRAVAGTAVTASSFYSEGAPNDNPPYKASDWSGITGTFPSGVASTVWWTSWAAETLDPNEWIAWDFGDTCTLSKVHVWNFNESGYTEQGIKKLDIQKWTGTAWETVYAGLQWSKAPDSEDYAGFDQLFSTPITTSKIRFTNLVNYGSDYPPGVGEVVFYVPEPATMALLGLGGLVLIRKRKSR